MSTEHGRYHDNMFCLDADKVAAFMESLDKPWLDALSLDRDGNALVGLQGWQRRVRRRTLTGTASNASRRHWVLTGDDED